MRCGVLSAGPRTPLKITDAKLVCALVEKRTFLHRSLIVKSQHKITELVATLNRKGTSLFASKLPRRRVKLQPNQPENSLMISVSWQLRLLAKMLYAHKLSQGINRIWSHSLLSAKIEKWLGFFWKIGQTFFQNPFYAIWTCVSIFRLFNF